MVGVRALKLAIAAIAVAMASLSANVSDTQAKERRITMESVVAQAGASSGREYLELEERIRGGGEPSIAALRGHLADPDPVQQLMARVLLAWMEGRTECPAALEFLDNLAARLAKTPVGNPPPVGVVAELDDRFGPRAAECLALRLVKDTSWPHWRVMGVIFYLKGQKLPATTSALIRFAATTTNKDWQNGAIEAITAIRDPELSRKIDLERQRLASQRKDLPEPLRQLTP